MKALVIGLGSMGKRRIRLLNQISPLINIIGLDAREDRCQETKSLYNIETYKNMQDVPVLDCDIAFVCTSPLSHAELITWCLERQLNVFSEINLVDNGYEENINLAQEKGLTLFLSSTFLYRDEIKYINEEVKKSNSLLSYSYHIGQYLPDWHPWENYTDYFIGDSKTDGCREIMAIEFPWVMKTFGKVISVSVLKNKKTGLSTVYNDSYLLQLEHDSGIQGSMLVDVVSRKPVRNLEIFGEDLYLSWDGSPEGLKKYNIDEQEEKIISLYSHLDQQKEYASFVVENAYKNEILAFLEVVAGKRKAEYGFADDLETLQLIDLIEENKT